jgi:xanthine/CO dehydrogenase XdhC/CoxF family maturation factor
MLMTPDRWLAGSISGGCLESDLLQTAWARTEKGPAIVNYDSTAEDDIVWGFGLGCRGSVDVLLERIDLSGGPLQYLAEVVDTRTAAVMCTVVSEGPCLGMRSFRTANSDVPFPGLVYEAGMNAASIACERIVPPMPLIVYGAGNDAMPLVSIAKSVGWHVSVLDWRPAFANVGRFPDADVVRVLSPEEFAFGIDVDSRAAIVLMTHNYLHDRSLLETALRSPARYVGLLGPSSRTHRLLNEVQTAVELPESDLKRLHAPIGLTIGAEGPDEIALAVVAEIQSVLNEHEPRRNLQNFKIARCLSDLRVEAWAGLA